jgi:ABC-type phosphate transport system auxiliary subunit
LQAAQPSAEESEAVASLRARVHELEGQVEEVHEEAEKRMRVLGQEMESVRLQNEKRVATLTQTNRQLSDKLAVKHGKEPQLV